MLKLAQCSKLEVSINERRKLVKKLKYQDMLELSERNVKKLWLMKICVELAVLDYEK